MEKIKKLIQSEAIRYLFFGGLTTLVNLFFVWLVLALFDANSPAIKMLSQLVGQITSIIFAFFTNRKWVFKQTEGNIFAQFIGFAAGRVGFAALTVLLTVPGVALVHFLFGTTSKLSTLIYTLIMMILNILFNYFWSKLLVFRKK